MRRSRLTKADGAAFRFPGVELTEGELNVKPVGEPAKPENPQPAFGRIYQPNPGSQRFPLRSTLPRAAFTGAAQRSKTWQMGSGTKTLVGPHGAAHSSGRGWQSQSFTSHCVRYGLTHLLLLEPVVRLDAWQLTRELYQWAQRNDPWTGEEPTYYGTSVDAGLRFLLHVIKVIGEYRWPRNMDEVRARLTASSKNGGGPLVVGSDFYSGMGNLDRKAATLEEPAIWTPDGNWWGGHCWVARGWKKATAKRSARVLCGNSHLGNEEGEMEESAFEWLIFQQNGEASAITELPRGYAKRAA
jgi:hypothetical protein